MAEPNLRIAVLGAGGVGQALASGLVQAGHSVVFGVRDLEKAAATAPSIPATLVAEAVADASIVVLAVPYEAAIQIVRSRDDWEGRILVDVTIPVILPEHSGLLLGTTTSGAEEIARNASGGRVVKAFSTTFADVLADPSFAGGKLFMPIAGDDDGAVATIVELASCLGMDGVAVGPLSNARYLEPLAMISVALLFKGYGRGFGFVRVGRQMAATD